MNGKSQNLNKTNHFILKQEQCMQYEELNILLNRKMTHY